MIIKIYCNKQTSKYLLPWESDSGNKQSYETCQQWRSKSEECKMGVKTSMVVVGREDPSNLS